MNPILKKQWGRFKKRKRGYYSLWIVGLAFFLSLFAEWICNDIPLYVHYQGRSYFPVLKFYPAKTFGDAISVAPNYKVLRDSPKFKDQADNYMIFPPLPYGANESMRDLETFPPTRPTSRNLLGTDDRGRDLLTRLIYGFRNSMIFALSAWFLIVVVGYTLGAFQGYLGGWVDLYGQRLTEIWNALPFLYVVIFLVSVFRPSLSLLLFVWVLFGWIGVASYVRAEVLRVRQLDFVLAAKAIGAGTGRILFRHIFRNTLTPILTLSPFIIATNISALAALDFLGLGLPPPTASWGELLRQGKENLSSWWLATFPFMALFGTLMLLNFVGEAVRSAMDVREA